MPTLATNPRAKFDYDILKTFEAGIVMTGQEVKSVRGGNVSQTIHRQTFDKEQGDGRI